MPASRYKPENGAKNIILCFSMIIIKLLYMVCTVFCFAEKRYKTIRCVVSKCMDTSPSEVRGNPARAWLSPATDAVLLRSHEANGPAVGWLPWVREELCVSCRLDCRARPSRESFPPGSVGPLATMAGALLMSCCCSHALRLEPDGGEALASPTSGDTRLIQLRSANILACYTAAN